MNLLKLTWNVPKIDLLSQPIFSKLIYKKIYKLQSIGDKLNVGLNYPNPMLRCKKVIINCSNLQFCYHFTKEGNSRGYDQPVGLIKK